MREWWRDAVIYQIYPRSYQDTTGNGVGDLAGITRRLEHIADLGADCIWLSPIFASPQADMGYDVSDYTDIDPLFGTLADFDVTDHAGARLGPEGHCRSGVVTYIRPACLVQAIRAAAITRKPTGMSGRIRCPTVSPPQIGTVILVALRGSLIRSAASIICTTFLGSQPDLNFHNPDVVDAILETCKFWLGSWFGRVPP